MEYTQSQITDIIKEIEKDFGVSVIDLECNHIKAEEYKRLNGEDRYNNCSCCCGDEIILGFYNDNELKLVSLFHELGHIHWKGESYDKFIIGHDYRDFPKELHVTDIGLSIARGKGIYFSDHALSWIYAQAFSYLRDENDRPIPLIKEMKKEFRERKFYGRYR